MVVATRLLIAGGGGSFTPPAALTSLAAAPHGGWTQTQGPHGVQLAGYTYFTFVNGSADGSIQVAGLTPTGSAISPITLHAAITHDSHDAGSLLVRVSDHKLMVWYSGHDSANFYQRVSVNSLDSDPTLSGGFAAETNLDSQLGGLAYTYPFVGQFADGTIWLGFRDDSTLFYLCLAKSTDDGVTWSAETKVWARSLPQNSYWMVHFGSDRIDMAVSTDNGITGTHVSLYHAYIQGSGNPYTTAGVQMSGSEPLDQANATLVHDGSAYPNAWASGMTVDGTGAPVILYETLDTANGHSYGIKYARWNGSAWVATTISTFSDSGLVLIAHSALADDGLTVWTVEPVSGIFEVWEHVTQDHGATFAHRQLTSGSSSPGYVYPASVRNGISPARGLVMGGAYVATDNFNVATYGIR